MKKLLNEDNIMNIEQILKEYGYAFTQLFIYDRPDKVYVGVVKPRDLRDTNILEKLYKDLVKYADSVGKRIDVDTDFYYKKMYMESFLKSLGFLYNRPKRDYAISAEWFRYPNAKEKPNALKTPEYLSTAEKKAVRFFGATGNIYEAGFILTNGTLLDLSLKKEGGMAGTRGEDHNAIEGATDLTHEEAGEKLGIIRMSASKNDYGSFFDIRKEPTKKQYSTLQKIISQLIGHIDVELFATGKQRLYKEYENERPLRIINDIKRYYSTNESLKYSNILKHSRVIKEQNPLTDFGKAVGNNLVKAVGTELADVLGGLATGFLRAVPSTLVTAFSDKIGKTITRKFIEQIHREDITEIKNWYYGNKLYYRELARMPISSDTLKKINDFLVPAFNVKGYLLQVGSEIRTPRMYLAQLFVLPARRPILDTKKNPRIFPIPANWLDSISTLDEAKFTVEYLSELWELK